MLTHFTAPVLLSVAQTCPYKPSKQYFTSLALPRVYVLERSNRWSIIEREALNVLSLAYFEGLTTRNRWALDAVSHRLFLMGRSSIDGVEDPCIGRTWSLSCQVLLKHSQFIPQFYGFCFSHGDLLDGNILIDSQSGAITGAITGNC